MTTTMLNHLVALFDELIEQQTKKVVKLANEHYPGISREDLRNPQDFPKLMADAQFNFEDGILAGYLAAKIAIVRELRSEDDEKS